MSNLEYCIECNDPTGNAGKDDDSLYVNHKGPYCQECYDDELLKIDLSNDQDFQDLIDSI